MGITQNMQHPAQITKHLQCKKQCCSLQMDRCCANHIFVLFSLDILIFCIATIHLPKKKSENVIPMLGGKRTSKTHQKNDRPNKQRKVQKWKNHLEIFENLVLWSSRSGGFKKVEICIPTEGEKQQKKWTPCSMGITILVFSTPLMRKHHFWKWCVARICV